MQRIVYFTYPPNEIAGGIKAAYRHVEALREAGFAAFVAPTDSGSPSWFETTAPRLRFEELAPETDVLVFPENHNGLLQHFVAWPNLKVVFCQNQYQVHRGLGERRSYRDYGVGHLICPGQVVATFCRRRFRELRSFIVPNYTDPGLFHYQTQKRLQIAFIPQKRPAEAAVIRDLFLSDNPDWRGIPWVQIAGFPEHMVARILGESALYLSLCRHESFSLALLEALASGCITAGFTGFGGREMATAKNGFWAAEDDSHDCATQLALAVDVVTEGGDRLRDMFEAAVGTAQLFSREKFVTALRNCWQALAPGARVGP